MKIEYTHKPHPRSRSIKIRVEESGEIIVSSPKRVSKKRIDQFVTEQHAWIEKALVKIKKKKDHIKPNEVMIFGKKYIQHRINSDQHPYGVSILENKLLINTEKSTYQAIITRFLKNTAHKYLIPRTHQIAQIMSITFKRISLKKQKTRWGSCSTQGNLNFNWMLVQYDPEIIDYVIIHELAHRKHMNHSTSFWNLVGQYDPDYLKHRNWLKKNGTTVQ